MGALVKIPNAISGNGGDVEQTGLLAGNLTDSSPRFEEYGF